MRFASWPIRARLTFWYLAVLVPATAVIVVGSWLLMRHSLTDAADTHLRTRLESAHRLLHGMEKELSLDEIRDELHEYTELTLGDGLIEVTEGSGTLLCQPPMAGWSALRAGLKVPALDEPPTLTNGILDGRPIRVIASNDQVGPRSYVVVAALPMGPANDALRRFGWILGAFAPAVLLIAGLGGTWISRRALAPVDQLTSDVQAMTLSNLDRRLDVPPADDEIRRLATTFNDMLARLEAGVADMARFTADAAHELRTPVTLVRTTAELTLSRERSEAEYRQALQDVLKLSEQMSSLVGGLLVLARADAGVEPRATAHVDLRAVVREVVAVLGSSAVARELILDLDALGSATTVTGDEASLRRLLLILIDNAIKYTPSGGAVRVSLSRHNDAGTPRATIEVTDTGPGIDPVERTRVFDRFYRGTVARQQVPDGAGLGLSIAQAIVRRHDGTIVIDAGPRGVGCRVSVSLPSAS
jgi:heavy metal sensor kinase